jgi:hypothetical protein
VELYAVSSGYALFKTSDRYAWVNLNTDEIIYADSLQAAKATAPTNVIDIADMLKKPKPSNRHFLWAVAGVFFIVGVILLLK